MSLFVTADYQQADRCRQALIVRKIVTETFADAGARVTVRGIVWGVQADDWYSPSQWKIDIREA